MVKAKDFVFIEKKSFVDYSLEHKNIENWFLLVSRINTHKVTTYGPFTSFDEAVGYAAILNVELKNV